MLLLAASATEAEGQCVWVRDFVSAPRLCVLAGDLEAVGAAEVDKIPKKIQPSHAAALAFLSDPHRLTGWAQPP